jgi:HlyD family secretion protein
MKSGKPEVRDASVAEASNDLPLEVRTTPKGKASRPRSRRVFVVFAAVIVVVGVLGLLWAIAPKPPGTVADLAQPAQVTPAAPASIAALGHLEPAGGVIAVTPPSSSRDAVVSQLFVQQGAVVEEGDVLATFETRPVAEAALGEAAAQVAVREAELVRARRAIEAAKAQAEAQIAVAQVQLASAEQTLARANRLAGGSSMAPATLEELQASRDVRAAELSLAEARRVELQGAVDDHPDVVSAKAALAAAETAEHRARVNLENTMVRAPAAGQIVAIAVRRGEPAPSEGMMRLAVSGPLKAILEVHQDRIHLVAVGSPVVLRAAAIEGELTGHVESIGVEVQRQAVFASDPAANSDARVLEVRVALDEASSEVARELINLQVLAAIQNEAVQ